MTTVALIVAAGRGERFGDALPKQYQSLAGEPLLRHSVRRFAEHPAIGAVRVVIDPAAEALYRDAVAGLPVLDPVPGGATRQQSVRLGLESLSGDAERVLIHDGARPFPDRDLIHRVVDGLAAHDGAVAALPVVDTLKAVDDGSRIARTVPRDGLWRAQTPQGFRFAAILSAHAAAAGRDDLTDDAAVAELAGLDVVLVPGGEDNFKVTTPGDLERAERVAAAAAGETRVGTGFDVHRFEAGDAVILCGVEIVHDRKLAGHSDADVALHAVTDAILGALGDGDIGEHFPPGDPQWRGAPSSRFVADAVSRVAQRGGRIVHVDLTVICEVPKLAPHRGAMRERLAQLLRVETGRVSVKATTTEGLGFTGRREGIAAQATVTLQVPG